MLFRGRVIFRVTEGEKSYEEWDTYTVSGNRLERAAAILIKMVREKMPKRKFQRVELVQLTNGGNPEGIYFHKRPAVRRNFPNSRWSPERLLRLLEKKK